VDEYRGKHFYVHNGCLTTQYSAIDFGKHGSGQFKGWVEPVYGGTRGTVKVEDLDKQVPEGKSVPTSSLCHYFPPHKLKRGLISIVEFYGKNLLKNRKDIYTPFLITSEEYSNWLISYPFEYKGVTAELMLEVFCDRLNGPYFYDLKNDPMAVKPIPNKKYDRSQEDVTDIRNLKFECSNKKKSGVKVTIH